MPPPEHCVLASQSRRFSGSSRENVQENVRENVQKNIQVDAKKTCAGADEAGGPFRRARPLRDLWIELALDVTLRHLGGGQHLLDLARLTGGIEFLQPLLAEFRHRFHRRLEIFARIEFAWILVEYLADLARHRHAVVGVDIDLADAVLDAALDLGNR